MTKEDGLGIAFCWYEPEEWVKLKHIASDAEALDDSFKDWKSNANRAISGIRMQGHEITKISIKVDELVAWCKKNNSDNNAEARSRFAINKLQKRKSET